MGSSFVDSLNGLCRLFGEGPIQINIVINLTIVHNDNFRNQGILRKTQDHAYLESASPCLKYPRVACRQTWLTVPDDQSLVYAPEALENTTSLARSKLFCCFGFIADGPS